MIEVVNNYQPRSSWDFTPSNLHATLQVPSNGLGRYAKFVEVLLNKHQDIF